MRWRKMKRIFKWFFGIIFLLMAIISALLLIFKDDIRDYAIEEANQYLNKKVHISSADVSFWKTFPNLTLSFGDVLVYSRFDTLQTADTALYAKQLDLQLNPFDFYKGKYNIQAVKIQEAKVNLTVLENGEVNYDFLKPSQNTASTPFQFKLEDILFTNTLFSYKNASTKQFYSGYFNTLKLSGVFSDKQFMLTAQSDLKIHEIRTKSVALVRNKAAKCTIRVKMDKTKDVFEIQSADVTINHLPFLLKGRVTEDSLHFYIGANNLSLPAVANNFGFQQLQLIHAVKGNGVVNFELSIDGLRGANTDVPKVKAKFSVKNGSLTKKGFNLSNIELKGKYSNEKTEKLELTALHFHTLNKDFDGQLTITDFEHPKINGKANGIIDLAAIHQLFGPFGCKQLSGNIEMNGKFDFRMNAPQFHPQDITIYELNAQLKLSNVRFQALNDSRIITLNSGELSIQQNQVSFQQISANIGASDLQFSGTLSQLSGYLSGKDNLQVSASIRSKHLLIDDLSNKLAQKVSGRKWLLPTSIKGAVTLDFSQVKYQGHEYKNISTKLMLGEHVLFFPDLSGENAGAQIKGSLKIAENSPMILTVSTRLTSDNVYFKPLFKEWHNFQQNIIKAENVGGKASINLQLEGPFDLYKQEILKDKFDVLAQIKIHQGSLTNVQAFKAIVKSLKSSAARLLLSKNKIKGFEDRLLHLKFDSFENEFRIKNGILTIPKMAIRSNALDVNVYGTHSFSNAIDYHFDFRFRDIKGNKHSQFGDIVDDGSGFRVYLHLYGTVEKPQFEWDKNAQKATAQQRKEQAKEDFKSALKTGFGIGKNDSTIQQLNQEQKREDEVIMSFEKDKNKAVDESSKKEKKGLGKKIFQWKKQKQNEEKKQEPTFTLDTEN